MLLSYPLEDRNLGRFESRDGSSQAKKWQLITSLIQQTYFPGTRTKTFFLACRWRRRILDFFIFPTCANLDSVMVSIYKLAKVKLCDVKLFENFYDFWWFLQRGLTWPKIHNFPLFWHYSCLKKKEVVIRSTWYAMQGLSWVTQVRSSI